MCEVLLHWHSAYLTNIRRNASAGFGLHVERVPVAYQRVVPQGRGIVLDNSDENEIEEMFFERLYRFKREIRATFLYYKYNLRVYCIGC
jgi:hypothetical protein